MSFRVLVNLDGQYSVWPEGSPIPAGWVADGTTGSREECLEHVDAVWTDQRPARAWIAEAVSKASDGELTPSAVLAADCSFTALGVPSLALVRLVDAIETEFAVTIELDNGQAMESLDSLTAFVARQRLPA